MALTVPPAGAERIELRNGDVLTGKLVERNGRRLVLEHAVMGRVRLARKDIRKIGPGAADDSASPNDGTDASEPAERRQPSAAQSEPIPEQPEGLQEAAQRETERQRTWLDEWDFELALGANLRESNRDKLDVNLRLDADYEDKAKRWKVRTSYYRSTTEGETSEEDVELSLRRDWLWPDSPWFLFGQTRYEHDAFKSWNHRLGMHGGLGLELDAAIAKDAKVRLGGGFTREFGGVEPDVRPEALVASELALALSDKQELTGSVEVFPGLESSGGYRVVASGDWTYDLAEGLGLRFGVEEEYDSTAPDGFEKSDLRLTSSIVFGF